MTKFRLILSGVIALSLFAMSYLLFVYDATINIIYLGPNTEYLSGWTGTLLLASILLALAGTITLYFTFFEFQEDEDGRLRFSNPNNFLLKFILRDKPNKPISSCSLFWNAVGNSLYLFTGIIMPIYFISIINYIKHEGWALQSFVALGISIWLLIMILNEFFSRFKFTNKLSSNSWLNKIWLAFFAVMVVTAIISNPMAAIYVLLVFLGVGAIVFVNIWLSGKSSANSLFRRNVESSKEDHCPIIYPKNNEDNNASRAVR